MKSVQAFNKRILADWVFQQSGGNDPALQNIKVSTFPTTVHVELLKLGKIPDPVRWLPTSDTNMCGF
jgi:beta-mannosidase